MKRISTGSAQSAGEFQHRARKRFGQNFLHDANVIARIVDAIAPTETEHLLEIGPGKGALTRHLLQRCGRLDTIELDRDLAGFLRDGLQKEKSFTVHQGDVLKFDLDTLTDRPQSLRVVGNLPYNISTPVLFFLLEKRHLIKDLLFMLQREVVQRLTAGPGDKNYGRLGLMTQYHCRVEHLFDVPSSAFAPQPKVISAIVRLTPYQAPPVPARDVACLQNVIRTAFSQRRKTLRNSLRTLMPETELDALNINPRLRAENLALSDFVKISDAISG